MVKVQLLLLDSWPGFAHASELRHFLMLVPVALENGSRKAESVSTMSAAQEPQLSGKTDMASATASWHLTVQDPKDFVKFTFY